MNALFGVWAYQQWDAMELQTQASAYTSIDKPRITKQIKMFQYVITVHVEDGRSGRLVLFRKLARAM